MKLFMLVALAAGAIAGSPAFAQSPSAARSASAPVVSTPNADGGTASQYRAGRATGDSNKMGIAGPESPVDAAAPNAESCKTISAPAERDKCMAKARATSNSRAAASGPAAPAATRKP